VEVGPSSFTKIKMLGKGDVGRVYLVREKKTNKLYAMKGNANLTLALGLNSYLPLPFYLLPVFLPHPFVAHKNTNELRDPPLVTLQFYRRKK
jgi:hypothetical protein